MKVTHNPEQRTYTRDAQTWKHIKGSWYVMMWGWWPDGNGLPAWRWQHIEDDRVPRELKEALLMTPLRKQ